MPKATDYDKMTPREHVLARPDTYIGDIEPTTDIMDVYDGKTITTKTIKYVPGFLKCFDELLVNASDAAQNDPNSDTISIEYTDEYIKIYNNGIIPVEEHPEHKSWVPSMIFGELLTSSNYDDSKKRTTGGRNGYGSKLCNIYATRFEVTVGDFRAGKLFHQVWKDNMSISEKPSIKKYTKKTNYVEITFYPDLARFGLSTMDEDHKSLFYRRAMDIAGISNKLKVSFNDTKIEITNFKQYIQAYYPESDVYYDDSNERWTVGCIFIPDSGKVVSFVNSIATHKGGSHVNHVMDKVLKPLIDDYIKKKHKDIKITPAILKENMIFFINSLIENPQFSSQTKVEMTTKPNKFGSAYEPTDAFMKKLAKSGLIDHVVQLAKFKETSLLKKNDGKKTITLRGIPKLDDANKAGSKDSYKCALILTEGDSAKALVTSGLSIIGRDYFGVFPLKGKLLNAREAPVKQLMENEEINNIIKIIGLKHREKYETPESIKTLRYTKIICLTDQDVDGAHIKGLIINVIHYLWPALLKLNTFVTALATPIVKAFKGDKVMTFYNLTEYKTWYESASNGWRIKYFKGLGTSTAKDAKEYFTDIETKLVNYTFNDLTDDRITLAFQKNRADDRKKWLMNYDKDDILTYDKKSVSYDNFVDRELKHFSNYDNIRSLAHLMDGFKPSQRKILFGTIESKLGKNEVKVSQLAGIISAKSAYHHGEASLMGAIINMAQDYVGSNNINLLEPNGQFGTRLQGGKDSASPRYIFTKLSEKCMKIFNEKDNNILNYLDDDGVQIEPDYYIPIIPMILVNGTEGIGTGFSTYIPSYNPVDIIENLLIMLESKKFKEMKPFWNNFSGRVTKKDKNNFETHGVYSINDNGTILKIIELPIGMWTQTYKEFLEKMLEDVPEKPKSAKGEPATRSVKKSDNNFIGYKEYHTDTKVHFELEFKPDYLDTIEDIPKLFRLVSKISLTNMHLFSVNGTIKKYISPKEIMDEYFARRLELYDERKKYLLNEIKRMLELLSNKIKFILMVVEKTLLINNRKKSDIEEDLIKHNFDKIDGNYDYLLGMAIYQLTYERIEALKKQRDEKQVEFDQLSAITPDMIWKNELIELRKLF